MERLETTKITIAKVALFCSIIFSFYACSESEAQREFEDQALQPPSGIMAMNANGNHPEGSESDSSDWETAPDFRSLIRIEKASYPNPVFYNSNFQIEIYINSLDALEGVYIYAFQQPSQMIPLPAIDEAVHLGLNIIPINPQNFAQSQGTGTIGNTWRIILFDGQQKIISYGDVLVE